MSDQDPPGDDDGFTPRPLMGRAFWALLLLALVCVLAGIAVATLAPRLTTAEPAAASRT